MKRYGILGGAFDPPHNEHLKMAEAAMDKLALDKIIILPSYCPPHKDKKNLEPFSDRVNMLAIYAENKPYVVIDELEKEMNLQDSFTYLTLPELKKRYGDAEYYYIIGGDSMVNFRYWRKPELIAKEARIAVIPRVGYNVKLNEAVLYAEKEYGADITVLDNVILEDVSSSVIKAKLWLGADVSGELPREIYDYIKSHGLYTKYVELIEKIKEDETPNTFAHSERTALYAVRYAGEARVSAEKAFLAGMLHDVMKNKSPLKEGYDTESPEVIHQYDAPIAARERYGITDTEILDAIEYHTTGKPNMSALGKLIYCADKLEPNRNYEGVDKLRAAIEKDFEEGFYLTLASVYGYLTGRENKYPIDDLTKRTFEVYTESRKNIEKS